MKPENTVTSTDKLLCEVQEMLRNMTYADGVATGLTCDLEAVENAYHVVRLKRLEEAIHE